MLPMSTISHQSIRNNPSNNSPSKISYGFSKTRRFINHNPECPTAFYANDSQLSNRKAGFGYGTKSDFTKDLSLSPPSTNYHIKSIFDQKNKGISFGVARQKSPDRSYLIPQIHKHPGVGHYENQIETRMFASYSLRPKPLDVIDFHSTSKYTPGPGAYQSIDLDPLDGRITVSKFGDAKYAKINPKTPRFPQIKDSPGPLSYRQGNSLSEKGSYVLSQFKGKGKRVFEKQARFTADYWKISKNPGPGDYSLSSDFGVYGDARYYKTINH